MYKKCFLVGIFTLLSLSVTISAQPVHPTTGEPLAIDCLRGTPDAIDGDLSDWNLEAMTPAVLDVVEQVYSGQASWDNVADCSGEVYLLWDDVNIYIAAVVKDDKLSMNKTDASIWNSDCVEVFFSTTDAEASHSWTNPTIHYQYGFNANNQKWNWCNMDGPGQSEPDYLQIASSVTADGYILEASIEYAQMLSLDFSAGNTIGLHTSIDDTDIDNGDTEVFMTWTGLAPHDQSLGYGHVVLSADSVPEPEPEPVLILKLDVGNSHNAEELEEGFTSFTLDDSGSKVDGATIEFGGINAGDARRRGEPAGVPYENIYRDFIFGRQSEAGVGYVSVKLSGLMANKTYSITLYSWDVGSTNTRIADWTANGEPLFTTIHDGSVDPPAAKDDYAYTAAATADAEGVILMEAVPGEGTFADQPFAFINALVVELQKTVLFAEDFEGLVLGPNVDEVLAGDAVWTDTPPEGWSVDESGIPGLGLDATDGVTEWAGWAFTDKAWWIEAAEDQDRSLFELGSGIVAVADPDEWDDAERLPIPISADPYDTWLTTPAIDISGIEAGTLELKFDSSWRPEFDDNYHQTANITASFDGGDPVEVLRWESDEASDYYHPYATNETVIVALAAPADAKKLVLTFGLFDAGNDWWWAIDNIEVRAVIPEIVPVDPGTDGLLAFWPCDEGEGAVVSDASGNGRDGAFVFGDPAWVEGISGSAVELVGPTLIEVPPLGMELSEATMAGWINPNGPQPDWSSIIMHRNPGPAHGFNILGYQLAYHWNDDSASWSYRGGDMIAEDDWTFVAVTIEADKATFYVNGIKGSVNEITHAPAIWDGNIYLGGDGNDNWIARRMNGALDDVVMYDRALSAGEIQYLAGFRPSELVAAFAFGARQLDCATYNKRTVKYTIVHHTSPEAVQYDPARGYGYEVIYPTDSPYGDRAGYGIFGPFDDSPNDRNEFPDECPEELYDSFIGAKSFLDECSAAVMGDMDTPCDVPEGIIFRVDVPNGLYRFVGAFGEADNRHAHRIVAEDGGSGPPENIGPNHVVLVSNHDQAQYDIGEIADDDPGDAVFARVGFDDKIPPPGDGVVPSPVFVNMDENGMPTNGAPRSPILEVTQGYIRIHQLQGNSNDGPGGSRDANGGDAVILELWKIEPDEAENLLANGSFEEDELILDDPDWLQWCTWNPAEGAGSNTTIVDTDAADGARSLKVEPIGVENWHFIVLYLPIMVDMEKNYTANFWAKAESPRPLTVQMKATDNSINAWGATTFDLTTEWAEYSYTSEVLIDNVKLEILCAGSEVPFLLDLVSVFEAE